MKKQTDSNWNIYILQKKNVMAMHQQFVGVCILFTPHAQCERGKVIGVGVLIHIYVCGQKKKESYFNDRLILSIIGGRTSRRIIDWI